MYQAAGARTLCGMKRLACLLPLLIVAACSSTPDAPAYSDPKAMSDKAWSAAGITSCGDVDEAATIEGGHYLICDTNSGQVRFVTTSSESVAQEQADFTKGLGLMVERRGLWVVGAATQDTLDKVIGALMP